MFCPYCGKKNVANAKFCKECGKDFNIINPTSTTAPGTCPYCAEEINPNAIKCKHCGEWLNKDVEKKPVEENHTAAIVLGYIFTLLGGFIGLIFALYLITRKSQSAKQHGAIMLIIFIVWIIILAAIFR